MRTPLLLGPARRDDDGFILLETLVAIGLIAVVMAALTTFFVGAVASTSTQRATQVATQLANSSVDTIRSLPASDPVNGHDASSVAAQFNAAPAAVAPWLSSMTAATDPKAVTGSGATAAVPTVGVAQIVNNITYGVTVYLGNCVIPSGVLTDAVCASAAAGTGIQYLRAVVAVTWTGQRCPAGLCSYVTATLLSTVDDPLFNVNQAPPPAPVMTNPGAQTSAVGDTVSLPLIISATPTYSVAITAGNLPAGLVLSQATGLISGTPVAVSGATSVTLTLTDGFGRTPTTATTFTWTVVAAVSVPTKPSPQASLIGTAITALAVAATGGTPGYTWSDPGSTLPPGLTLSTVNNQATITGTPTSAGLAVPLPSGGAVFPVSLTVTDSRGRVSSVGFSWTINYPPIAVTNPGTQTSTVGAPDTVALGVTGGSGSFAWTSSTLPAGLTVSSTGVISGAPTTVGTTQVTLTVTDTKVTGVSQNVAFTWTVYAKPTVISPGNQNGTVGQVVSVPLTTTCPDAPCTYVLNNGPATLAISGTGVLTGTITSAAQTFSAATVTVTDSAGASVSSAAFGFTVNAAPTIANPGTQTVPAGSADTLDVAALVGGGTRPLTYAATNLPSWLSLNPSTGMITGTAPTASGTTTGIKLTVTDAVGVSATSAAFSWVVTGNAPSAPLAVRAVNGDATVAVSWSAPASTGGGAVTRYTATLSPGGGSCSTTGALTCSISGLTNGRVYTLTVTATNAYGTGPGSATVTAIPYPGVMSAAGGMTLWLDGADPAVLLGSSTCTGAATTTAIGCWKDKSPQGQNFIQATATSQPGVSSWNGLSAANFADNGDILNSINSSDTYQTVFVAANVLNAGSQAQYVDLFGQATQDYNVRIGSGIGRNSPNVNDWSYNSAGTGAQFDWANGAQGVNVSPPGAVITSDQAPTARSFAASVSNTFLGRGVVGQVGDVITFGKVLTTADRRAVEQYLSNKWGAPVTSMGPPSEPLTVAAVNGDAAINASWTPPTDSNGAAITGYTATVSPGGGSCSTAGALGCAITGLTNGVAYSLTVTATNSAGTGPSSAMATGIPYPAGVMSAANGMTLWLDGADPTVLLSSCTGAVTTTKIGCWKDKSTQGENFVQSIVNNQPGVGTWNGLTAANFADSTDVLNSINSGDTFQTAFVATKLTAPASEYDLLGASVGGFNINVRVGSAIARNAPPSQSDWSFNTGTPPLNWANGAQGVNVTVGSGTSASTPLELITADQGQASAQASATISNTSTGHGVVGAIGDVINFNNALSTPERRAVEEYLAHKWGVTITPQAPTAITAVRSTTTSATVSWTPPSFNGGAAVGSYTVKSAAGTQVCPASGTSCTVTGLSSRQSYTFTVTATNSAGTGPASAVSGSV